VSSIRNLLCAALAASVLLSAPSAEARFGKHSDSSDSSDSNQSKTHDASAVGDDDGNQKKSSRRHSHASAGASFLVDLVLTLLTPPHPVVAYVAPPPPPPPPPEAVPPPPPRVRTSRAEPSPLFVHLGVDGAALDTTAGMGAFLGVEGVRGGMDARALALMRPSDDETTARDSLTLMSVHLTYALVARDRARLRLEGGFSSAHIPGLTAIGPSMALSLELGLASNLDLELRTQATPYPYRQFDGQAGLALHLNSVVLRGGWRTLYLDENGLVDGLLQDTVQADTFGGPYAGIGFAF
jgi:hypothetical protein